MTLDGSGFVIDPSGYVLTNRHVVMNAYSITVILSDGTRLAAKVIGHPPATDIALLKVETTHPLQAVTFGDSAKVRVGDKVLAIGNPLGLGETVTAGIVSALNRNTGESPYDNFIQTDAAINHGNSGGPLFDLAGRVIGVDTALFTSSATDTGSIGLGLAIPSDDALFAARELREFGEVKPGWIGAQLQEITPGLAAAFGLSATRGALVGDVQAGSPASQAGLRPGDVILAFDGNVPADSRALLRMIAKHPLDHDATLTLRRDGTDRTVAILVKEYPPAEMVADFPFELTRPPPMVAGDIGLRLVSLTEAARNRFGLSPRTIGMEVAAVPSRSAADRAGLRQGDVVLRVEDTPATSPDSVQQGLRRARQAGRADVALLIVGPSGQHWVAVPLQAAD
ncbi:MAG TPA: trypsin-like peptidase domain-containing protein [Acetobacteraceae bacterium]|nr:trypsin-like peptidase domain-containing protein [Acetobacteraceae bacterium]